MKPIFLIALLLLLSTACLPTPTPVAVPVSDALPTVFVTWTPKPTRTPIPPSTRRPTATDAATRKPDICPQPTRTEFAKDPAIATFWAPFSDCRWYGNDENLSPSGDWYICGSGSGFEVMHRDGTSWSFSPRQDYGIEYYGDFRLIHWTRDEKFLYFAVINPLGGPGPITANAEALFRMDLTDGKITTILGSIDVDAMEGFYTVSISPTSRRLAYSHSPYYRDIPPPTKLHIVDLQSDKEIILPVEARYNIIGRFAWSNDGLLLAYTLYNTSFEGYCDYSYSIRLLDLKDLTVITFVKDVMVEQCQGPPEEFNIQGEFDRVITLEKNGETWQYDIDTQRLRLISTPEP